MPDDMDPASPLDPPEVADRLRAIKQKALQAQRPWKDNPRYGVVDTTFAIVNMGVRACDQLLYHGVPDDHIHYLTVPGFKDLGAAARRLLDGGCDIVVCCGMAGPEPVDKQCAQDASFGMQLCQQHAGKPVLEVIVHMDETDDPRELLGVVDNRVREHATNAYWMMQAPRELMQRAGTGQRQGFEDVGPLQV